MEKRGHIICMVIVVFGVTGTGKSLIGSALANALGWRFIDADDFHGEANLNKLKRGIPLQDEDRWPWLTRLRRKIQECLDEQRNAVMACSALKRSYRHYLGVESEVVFVYLRTEPHALEQRLKGRRKHFASPRLLRSQLEALEEPLNDALTIDTTSSGPVEIVTLIRNSFQL